MSAAELTNAADALDREVLRLEHFTAAAKKLRELGSLEQAAEESQKRLDALKDKEAELTESNAKLEVGHADLIEKSKRVQEAHKVTMQQIDEAVDRRAADITNAATEQAQQIVGDAKLDAAAMVKVAQESADAIAKDAVEMKKAVDIAKAAHADLVDKHAELVSKIEKAQNTIKEMLGAA